MTKIEKQKYLKNNNERECTFSVDEISLLLSPSFTMVDKRKGDVSDSDDDFAPSPETSPAVSAKPAKKKPKAKAKADADGGEGPDKKEKKAKPNVLDYGVDLTSFDQAPDLTAKYAKMSTAELGQWLKANRITKGAPPTKANLVARCVDGELWGAPPACPRCHVGKLKVNYEQDKWEAGKVWGQGEWTCGGSYDESIRMYSKCYFAAAPGEVTRLKWRDVFDPAPEPVKPGAAPEKVVAFPDGFAAFPPKEAAAALRQIALELGYQLPTENANAEIGAKLMATKNDEGWCGKDALEKLHEDYPPLTTEEQEGGPPCLMPENDALATCLDKLVRFEMRAKGDAFKIRAYKTAAMEIRALDWVVTSGKACAKAGKTKVKGVGKGLGEKIDEFLTTGTMEKIEQLEGRTDPA